MCKDSGATAVCEGVGDHGCEYMTGGTVLVLGKTGKNFAAGMSGGVAYVLDENHDLYMRVNKALVDIEEIVQKHDIDEIRNLISEHYEATKSKYAKDILDNFDKYIHNFKKIMPKDYNKMLSAISYFEENGSTREEAEIEAFYKITKR